MELRAKSLRSGNPTDGVALVLPKLLHNGYERRSISEALTSAFCRCSRRCALSLASRSPPSPQVARTHSIIPCVSQLLRYSDSSIQPAAGLWRWYPINFALLVVNDNTAPTKFDSYPSCPLRLHRRKMSHSRRHMIATIPREGKPCGGPRSQQQSPALLPVCSPWARLALIPSV